MSLHSWLRSRVDMGHRARPRSTLLDVECLEGRAVPTAGALDPSFGSGGIALASASALGGNFVPQAAALQNDGALILAGAVDVNSTRDTVVLRFTPAGQLDTSFGNNGFFVAKMPSGHANGDNQATGVQVDGRQGGAIVVGGTAGNDVSGNSDFFVLRLTPKGTLDTTFGSTTPGAQGIAFVSSGTGEDDSGGHLIIDGSGNYVMTGHTNTNLVLVRFTSAGRVDATFGPGKIPSAAGVFEENLGLSAGQGASTDQGFDVVARGSEYLVVGSSSFGATAGNANPLVVEVNANGTGLDATFGPQAKASPFALPGFGGALLPMGNGAGAAIGLEGAADGNGIIVAGLKSPTAQSGVGFVARLSSEGLPDTQFAGSAAGFRTVPLVGQADAIDALAVSATDQIVLGGFAAAVNAGGMTTSTQVFLARYGADGTPDTTFGNNGVVGQGVSGMALALVTGLLLPASPAGAILVAGAAGNAGTAASPFVARFLGTAASAQPPVPSAGTGTAPANSSRAETDTSSSSSLNSASGTMAGKLTIAAPKSIKGLAGTIHFNHKQIVLIKDPSAGAVVTLRISSTAGTLHLGPDTHKPRFRGLKIQGNKSRHITLTGVAAALDKAVASLSLQLGGAHHKATIVLLATDSKSSARATITTHA